MDGAVLVRRSQAAAAIGGDKMLLIGFKADNDNFHVIVVDQSLTNRRNLPGGIAALPIAKNSERSQLPRREVAASERSMRARRNDNGQQNRDRKLNLSG